MAKLSNNYIFSTKKGKWALISVYCNNGIFTKICLLLIMKLVLSLTCKAITAKSSQCLRSYFTINYKVKIESKYLFKTTVL